MSKKRRQSAVKYSEARNENTAPISLSSGDRGIEMQNGSDAIGLADAPDP